MQHAIEHLKAADPVLAGIIASVGEYQMRRLEPNFDTLVRSIANQQISGKAAKSILGRLLEACGQELTPERVLRLSPQKMRSLGFSRQKTAYIRDLARHVRDGKLDFEALRQMEDAAVIARLTDVKGIGVWTAHMFLMFALERPNILPVGDLGVQNAIKRHYRKRKVTPKHVAQVGKAWHPYCSVATWYLWRSLDGEAQI
jgi:DNA-3-methyladenine glycosylase II